MKPSRKKLDEGMGAVNAGAYMKINPGSAMARPRTMFDFNQWKEDEVEEPAEFPHLRTGVWSEHGSAPLSENTAQRGQLKAMGVEFGSKRESGYFDPMAEGSQSWKKLWGKAKADLKGQSGKGPASKGTLARMGHKQSKAGAAPNPYRPEDPRHAAHKGRRGKKTKGNVEDADREAGAALLVEGKSKPFGKLPIGAVFVWAGEAAGEMQTYKHSGPWGKVAKNKAVMVGSGPGLVPVPTTMRVQMMPRAMSEKYRKPIQKFRAKHATEEEGIDEGVLVGAGVLFERRNFEGIQRKAKALKKKTGATTKEGRKGNAAWDKAKKETGLQARSTHEFGREDRKEARARKEKGPSPATLAHMKGKSGASSSPETTARHAAHKAKRGAKTRSSGGCGAGEKMVFGKCAKVGGTEDVETVGASVLREGKKRKLHPSMVKHTNSPKFTAHVGDPKDEKKPYHKGKGIQSDAQVSAALLREGSMGQKRMDRKSAALWRKGANEPGFAAKSDYQMKRSRGRKQKRDRGEDEDLVSAALLREAYGPSESAYESARTEKKLAQNNLKRALAQGKDQLAAKWQAKLDRAEADIKKYKKVAQAARRARK